MPRPCPLPHLLALLLVACAPVAAQPPAEPRLPAFDPAAFAAPGANPWFPLDPGPVRRFEGRTRDGEAEGFSLAVQGPGPTILGVPTVAVLDEATEDGRVVERTLDYFAADSTGTVWYLGEDVTNFRYDEEDRLIGTDAESAWRAGVNGALPGIIMPAAPAVGGPVFQEHAPSDGAMDWARIEATGLALEVGGRTYEDVVRVYESSVVEPGSRGWKYYAPGLGLIREEELPPRGDTPDLVVDLRP